MVKQNDVESSIRILNGIMANEGMFQRWMLTRRYGFQKESMTYLSNKVLLT